MEDFHNIFTFGVDYAERMLDVVQIPFWVDVLHSLKALWRRPVITEVDNVLFVPLWYYDIIRLPLKPSWFKKGISVIADLLDDNCSLMSMDVFQENYNNKTNFLEYGGLMLTIKYFLDNQEIPLYKPTRPFNSVININLHRDTKGVSNLYKCMYYHNCDILGNICAKWYDRGSVIFSTHDVRNSFVRTHALIDDIYLEYIQFRTLHYRFFTNDLLLKIKIKDTDLCSICNSEKDSNCHMLVNMQKKSALCARR